MSDKRQLEIDNCIRVIFRVVDLLYEKRIFTDEDIDKINFVWFKKNEDKEVQGDEEHK